MKKVTACELGALVIKTLDAQKKYFQTRDKDALVECKALERHLRDLAACAIVDGVAEESGAVIYTGGVQADQRGLI